MSLIRGCCTTGRWKGALVAIKKIEHNSLDTEGKIVGLHEANLCTSVQHPNVVCLAT